jgi:hypothetical protein
MAPNRMASAARQAASVASGSATPCPGSAAHRPGARWSSKRGRCAGPRRCSTCSARPSPRRADAVAGQHCDVVGWLHGEAHICASLKRSKIASSSRLARSRCARLTAAAPRRRRPHALDQSACARGGVHRLGPQAQAEHARAVGAVPVVQHRGLQLAVAGQLHQLRMEAFVGAAQASRSSASPAPGPCRLWPRSAAAARRRACEGPAISAAMHSSAVRIS